jgi:uncharacterized protein YlzI (FlbEa/FlbD family)
MTFLVLTDIYGNDIIMRSEEIVTIENDRNMTIAILRDGRKVLIKETVQQVMESIRAMR